MKQYPVNVLHQVKDKKSQLRCRTCYSLPPILTSLCFRAQAIAIGQALVDGRWLDCVTHHDQLFRDEYALYRPLQVNTAHAAKRDISKHFDTLVDID